MLWRPSTWIQDCNSVDKRQCHRSPKDLGSSLPHLPCSPSSTESSPAALPEATEASPSLVLAVIAHQHLFKSFSSASHKARHSRAHGAKITCARRSASAQCTACMHGHAAAGCESASCWCCHPSRGRCTSAPSCKDMLQLGGEVSERGGGGKEGITSTIQDSKCV